MKIGGKYYKIGDNVDCEVELLEGIISISTASGLDYSKINMPAHNENWKFKRLKTNENKILDKTIYSVWHVETRPMHKRKIEYIDTSGNIQKIFINPTIKEIIEIESQLNYWWTGRDKKFNRKLFFVVITATLSIIAGIILKYI